MAAAAAACGGDALPLPTAPPNPSREFLMRSESHGSCISPSGSRAFEAWASRLERRFDHLEEKIGQDRAPDELMSFLEQRFNVLEEKIAQGWPATRQRASTAQRQSQSVPQDAAAKPLRESPPPQMVLEHTSAKAAQQRAEQEAEQEVGENEASPDGSASASRRMRNSVMQWVDKTGVSESVFKSKRVGTKERIANHWEFLEQQSSSAARRPRWSAKIVSHKWFDLAITAVVLLSATIVGVQVDHEAAGIVSHVRTFQYLEYFCAAVFTSELALRIHAHGFRRLCGKKERGMSILDFTLVFISWVDIVMTMMFDMSAIGASASMSKLIIVVRVGRLLRIIRTIRLLSELRMMASMILNSFRSLTWLFMILLALGYSFALIITQGASEYASSGAEPENAQAILGSFGTVMLTMYSLFKCISGGISWGEMSDLIYPAGWFYRVLVVMYVFINIFSVMNIVTGVFVDGAIELGKRDRVMMIQKQGKKREAFAQHLVELLRDMGTSEDGVITREEFLASFSRHEVKEFMMALSIDLDDANNMFSLLDRNLDGSVDIVEFVMGMEKLRGEAKSSDIHFLIAQCQHITDLLVRMQGLQSAAPVMSEAMSRMASKASKQSRGGAFGAFGSGTLADGGVLLPASHSYLS